MTDAEQERMQPAEPAGADVPGAGRDLEAARRAIRRPTNPEKLAVSWLELFFDLAFVVVIGALTTRLEGSSSWTSLLGDFWLLIIVWTAWFNEASLTNLERGQDGLTRVCVLASMAGIGVMAVGVPDAYGSRRMIFVIGYALARVVLTPAWIAQRRKHGFTGIGWPLLHGVGFSAAWLLTLLLPMPAQAVVWGVLALAEQSLSLTRPQADKAGWTMEAGHMVERIGQFILITFGEAVAGLIATVSAHVHATAWVNGALAFALLAMLFVIFYDVVMSQIERVLEGKPEGLSEFLGLGQFLVIGGLIGVAAGTGESVHGGGPLATRILAGGVGLFMAGVTSLSFASFKVAFAPVTPEGRLKLTRAEQKAYVAERRAARAEQFPEPALKDRALFVLRMANFWLRALLMPALIALFGTHFPAPVVLPLLILSPVAVIVSTYVQRVRMRRRDPRQLQAMADARKAAESD